MKKMVLIGAGGHAKSIVDTIEALQQFEIVGFIERKNPAETEASEKSQASYKTEFSGRSGFPEDIVYRSYRIIGDDDDLPRIFAHGVRDAVICVGYMGNSRTRDCIYQSLKKIGYLLPPIIDNTAIIASDATIGEGTYIGKNVIVNAGAEIGKMCILNTGSIIEHECQIGDFSHIAAGAVLCGQARIGDHVLFGANATIIQRRSVGSNTLVGAGAVVIDDLPESCVAAGVPAHIIKKEN